jgi:hypothetical protein
MLPDCTHRDGAVYSVTGGWHKIYRISDADESKRIPISFAFPFDI